MQPLPAREAAHTWVRMWLVAHEKIRLDLRQSGINNFRRQLDKAANRDGAFVPSSTSRIGEGGERWRLASRLGKIVSTRLYLYCKNIH